MRILYLVLALALALAACAPPPDEPDWCYTYNFLLSDYDVNIQSGQWVSGEGFLTVGNELIVNWGGEYFVEQSYMSVTLSRPDGVVGDIAVSAIANIFGQGISTSFTFPAGSTTETIGINRDSFEVTKTFSLTMQTSQPLLVESLYLAGEGATPFDTNACGPATETPTNPPPSNTPLPATSTPTPTRTATPTGTATLCWRMEYDFRVDDYDMLGSHKQWVSGEGWRSVSYNPNALGWYQRVDIRDNGNSSNKTNVKRMKIESSFSLGNNPQNTDVKYQLDIGSSPTVYVAPHTSVIEFNYTGGPIYNFILNAIPGQDETSPVVDPGGQVTIHKITLWGTGSLDTAWNGDKFYIPCWDITPTPTLTATPTVFTNTPTATPTRTALPVTPFGTFTPSRTPLPGIVTATPSTPTITPTRTSSSTPLPLPPTSTPAPTNTPGPTNTPYAPPTYTTATGFPVSTILPPGYTPSSGGTGVPGPFGTPFGTPAFGSTTPIPTIEGLPTTDNLGRYHQDVYDSLNTAVAEINILPGSIDSTLPDVQTNLNLFAGYARWITSGVSLQELMGQKFYPIGVHTFYALSVMIFMTSARFILWGVVILIRFARWIIESILKIIPFIG